jgi:hypothetical protein
VLIINSREAFKAKEGALSGTRWIAGAECGASAARDVQEGNAGVVRAESARAMALAWESGSLGARA